MIESVLLIGDAFFCIAFKDNTKRKPPGADTSLIQLITVHKAFNTFFSFNKKMFNNRKWDVILTEPKRTKNN